MRKSLQHKIKKAEKITVAGIVKMASLTAVKLVVGMITGMEILFASALKSFTTLLSLCASYIGIKASQKAADKNFEYGYYKIETFAAFVASAFIMYLSIQISKTSILNIFEPPGQTYGFIGIVTVFVTTILAWRFTRLLEKTASEANLESLRNSASYRKIDTLSSVAVLCAAVAAFLRIPYLENILSVVIAIFIFSIALKNIKTSLFGLLDFWPDTELIKNIRTTILSFDKKLILGVKRIKVRQSGPLIFGEAFIDINPFTNIKDLQNLLNTLKTRITNLSPYFQDFSLHINLAYPPKTIVAVCTENSTGLNAKLAHKWADTNNILLLEINKRIKVKSSIPINKKASLESIVKQLTDRKTNVFISGEINSLLYYMLERLNQIRVYPMFINAKTVEDLAKMFNIDSR